jgi:hypothetical protein
MFRVHIKALIESAQAQLTKESTMSTSAFISATWREPRDGSGRRKHRKILICIKNKSDAMRAAYSISNMDEIGFKAINSSSMRLSYDGEGMLFSFLSGCGRETIQCTGNSWAIERLHDSFQQILVLRDLGFYLSIEQ